jgi:Cdc6-like AAA superfamily ATPase
MLYLGEAGRQDEVEDLIKQYTPVLMGSPEFLVQLARYALEHSRSEILGDLLKPSVMAILTEAQPLIAYRVAASAGRLDEAQDLAERVLESAIRRRSTAELQRVKKLFEEIGRSREFEEAIRRLPPGIANRVLGQGLIGPD